MVIMRRRIVSRVAMPFAITIKDLFKIFKGLPFGKFRTYQQCADIEVRIWK